MTIQIVDRAVKARYFLLFQGEGRPLALRDTGCDEHSSRITDSRKTVIDIMLSIHHGSWVMMSLKMQKTSFSALLLGRAGGRCVYDN